MKASYSSFDDIPEAVRSEYGEREGRYVLKLDGEHPDYTSAEALAAAHAKVVEFRDRNISLLKHAARLTGLAEVADLTPLEQKLKEYDGIDPREYARLKEQTDELEKSGVKKGSDVIELVQAQVNRALSEALPPLKDALEQERRAREDATRRANSATLREKVGQHALDAGAIPSALDFLLGQAEQTFEITDDGSVRPKGQQFSSEKPGEPLGIPEWVKGATKTWDFAFKRSQGGGADPKPDGSTGPPAGVRQLVDPSMQDLGKYADDIASGKAVVVSSNAQQ